MKPNPRLSLFLSSFCLALFAGSSAQAQSAWSGATNGLWGTSTNWTPNVVPVSTTTLTVLGPANAAGALNINIAAAAAASTINFTNTAATTLTNTTSGANQTLTLSGAAGITTGTGAVTIGSATANQNVNIALGASQTWSVGAGGLTVPNVISGATFGITKSGAGTLTLSGANTYTGTTSVSVGTLAIGTGGSIAAASPISVSSGATLTTGVNNSFSGAPTGAWTIAGTITGTGNAQTIPTSVTLNNGTMNGTAFATFGTFLNQSNLTTTITANGTTNAISGGNFGLANTASILALNTPLAGDTLTVSAALGATSALAGAVTKSGLGTVTLSGANTFTGNITLSAGTLNINNAAATGTAAGTFTITGGTINNTTGAAITTAAKPLALNGDFTFTGTQNLNLGAGAITLNAARTITANAGTLTLGGAITGATFGITKAGAGTLSLGGAIGTTTGGLTVNAGTVSIGSNASTFTGAVTATASSAILTSTNATPNGTATGGVFGVASGTLGANIKQITLTNGATFRPAVSWNFNAVSGTLPGNGYQLVFGAGGGNIDTPTGVTLTLDDGTTTGGTAAASANYLANSGTTSITKIGVGTLTLAKQTQVAASFNLNAGLTTLTGADTFGVATNTISVASGAALSAGNIAMTRANPLTLSGTGLAATPAGALTATANTFTWAGPITIASGGATIGGGAGALTLASTATINLGANTLTMANNSAGNFVVNGIISGGVGGKVVVTGTGQYVPNMQSTYTDGTTLSAGTSTIPQTSSTGAPGSVTSGPFGSGTITAFPTSQIRASVGLANVINNDVTLNGGITFLTAATENNFTFGGPVTLSGGNAVITSTVGTTVAGKSAIINGAIGDGGNNYNLTKLGAGNLTLGGANTYGGATIVNAGALVLSGSIPTNKELSVIPTVAGGASFSLASNTANPLTNVSTLTIGSATGPTLIGLDLGANTAASDSITTPNAAITAGIVNIGILQLPGFGSSTSYDLITAPSGLDGATSYVLSSAPGGYTYSLATSATSVTLNVNPAAAGDLYWRGNTGNSWSAFIGGNTNWFTSAAGSTNASASPGPGNTVNFSTVNATSTGGVITTTLDNNFTVKNLVFGDSPNGVLSVTVAAGLSPAATLGILAIAPTSSSDGISVGSNAGAIAITAPVILGTNQTWTVDGTGANGSTLNVSGPVSGSGTLSVNGLVTLSAPATTSTYSGATTVPDAGILQGGATNSFSANSAVTVSGTGILRLNGFSNTVLSLTGDGTVQNNHASTAATLTTGDATDLTFSGILQNGGVGTLGLTKIGSGKLTLSGPNTHTGLTTVSAGTLVFGSATTLAATNSVTLSGTGTLDLNGFSPTVGAFISAATNFITNNAAGTGTATLTISGSNPTVTALVTDGATAKTALRLNNANNGGFMTANNTLNTFSGGLILAHNATGTRMNINAAITGTPWGTSTVFIGETATDLAGIYFNTADNTFNRPIVFNTSLGTDRFGIRNDGRVITLSGQITANATAVFSSNNASASNTIITNKVTGAGGLAIDLSQTSTASTLHTVTLTTAANANDYAGDTEIGRANGASASAYTATLTLGAANQIPNGTGKGNVTVTNNTVSRTGTLNLAGFSETINGLSGNGTVTSATGTPTLTLGDNNQTATFSGLINGTLIVTKIGTGTQTLSGASTFAGPLNVNGGLVAFPSSPATSGPLGNSTVVNLNGGGISYTVTGANSLSRPIAIGASAGTVDVANSTGTLTIPSVTSTGGNLIKTGPGAAVISGSTTLNGGASSVLVNEGTLRAGFGASGVAKISVGSTGNLDLQNSAREALILGNTAGALTLAGGAQLGFELNGAIDNDSIAVGAGGTAVTSGVVTLNFYGTAAAGTYTLLAADGGLAGATYALGAAPNGFNYTINASNTVVTVTISAYIPNFWRGGQNLSWNTLGSATANWTNSDGTVDATSKPLGVDTVIFSAIGVTSGALNTTLDAPFTVDSLQFTNVPGSTDVTIAAGTGGSLTLIPASTSGGIRLLSGGGNATISAPLTIGAAQTWDVDPTGSLTISGDTTFTGNVNKTNTGMLTLSGTNSGAGNFTLSAGTLNLNSSTAVGAGVFTIGAGTTINTATVNTLTTNNVQNWNGDLTFTGTNNLNLGTGAVTLGASLAINALASNLTVGGSIGDGGNNRGITKAGAGTLVLTGSNTYAGLTNLTGGVLRITNANALGDVSGGVTQTGSSALELDGTAGAFSVGAESLTINGGGITNLGALRNIAGDNTYGGAITMGIQSRINSDSGTLTLNNAAAVSATNLTLVVGGAGNTTISGAIALGSGGVAKADGAGTLTLSGSNTYTGNTTLSAGTLNITGSITGNPASATLAYGGTAGNTIVNISGSVNNYKNFTGANIAGSIAVMNQTGGSTSTLGTNSADTQWVAQNGGYGYLNITGGIFNTGRFDAVAPVGGGGTAVIYVGGTGNFNNNSGDWLILPRTNGTAQLTVGPGGSLVRTAAVTNNLGITMDGANSHGSLNVAGGTVDTGVRPFEFGFGSSAASTGNRGFVNLAGGTLSVGSAIVQVNTTAGASYFDHFNFAGGTLKSNAAHTFLPAASAAQHTLTATIYGPVTNNNNANTAFNTQIGTTSNFSGGLTVDTNGFATSIAYPLSAASGVGVTQADIGDLSLLAGNSGYIGAPAVVFSPPAGVGVPATGYAVINAGSGKVNGIVITNPGVYALNETPTITLTGGGGSIAPFATAALTTANISGGLTKTGAGVLTLTGANTYAGSTIVTGGTLQLNGSAATLPTTSGITVATGGTLGFTAATASTLDMTGKSMTLNGGTVNFDIGATSDSITVQDFALTASSAFSFNSIGTIEGTYTLLTSVNPITNLGAYTITGQTVGRVILTPTVNANSITVTVSLDESQWNVDSSGNWNLAGNWSGYLPGSAGDAALFGSVITGPKTVTVDTPQSVGVMRFDNANAYTIGALGSSFLTLNNAGSSAVLAVTSGSHTIAENIVMLSNVAALPATGTSLTLSGNLSNVGGAKSFTMNGAGTTVLAGVNTYTGNTAVSSGTLNLTGSLTGGAAIGVNGTGVLSESSTGIISGASTLTHTSTGASTLAGANTYTGATTVTAGRLNVTGSINQTTASTDVIVANTAVGNAVLNISGGSVTSRYLTVGTVTGAAGAVYMDSGAFTTGADNELAFTFGAGSATGGYGYFGMSGGTVNTTRFQFGGQNIAAQNGVGVGLISGGTVNAGSYIILARYGTTAGTVGSLTIAPGATVNHTSAASGQNVGLGWQGAGRAELSLTGGNLTSSTGRFLAYGSGGVAWTGTGIVNLNQGTLTTTAITVGGTGATSYLNFSGGTLKGVSTQAAFLPAVTGAYVNGAFGSFAGGATIDSPSSVSLTIAAPLIAPVGNGVATIPVTDGGAGYIGAPYVSITDSGAGFGATAIANMVDDLSGNGTFKIASITITNPGNNYISPSVTLTGGGNGVTAATIGSPTTAANTSGGLTKVNTGTLILSGSNAYTGDTTISGGTLQLGAAGTTGSLATSSNIVNNGVFAINRTVSTTQGTDFGAMTSGTGSLAIASNTFLTAANTYGATTITAGQLQLITNGTLGSGAVANGSGLSFNKTANYTLAAGNIVTGTGAVILANTGIVSASVDGQFNTTGALTFGASAGAVTNSALDLANGSSTFGSLVVQTNSVVANTITLSAGKTLTINNGMTLGYSASALPASVSRLTAAGGGTLAISGTTVAIGVDITGVANSAWTNAATLDVTALDNFTANVTNFNVAVGSTSAPSGSVLLSNTANTLIANTLKLADTGGNNGSGPGTLTLGTGTNVLQVDTLQIGRGKGSGNGFLTFASQTTGSPGTVTIANKAGSGGAVIEVANVNLVGTAGGASGNLDLRGHVATVTATTLLMGQTNSTSNVASTNGTVSFDAGTFTVDTLNMSPKTGASTGTATSTLNVGGGAFTVNTAFTLGSQATAGASIATMNITGGTFTSNVAISRGGGSTTSTINLDGATAIFDLTNHSIGSATNLITLNAKQGTLKNLSQLNGGGQLTKTTSGTVTLTGTNTYTGATSVSEGTVALVGGSHASPITVSTGASLSFTLGSPTTSTSTFNVTAGTIKISGTPTLPSYTLISSSTGITGTPTLDAPIAGYGLKVVGNTLVLENLYEAWATATGATGGKSADTDGDGYTNLMEYAFGTDPTVNSGGLITYSGGVVTATGQPMLEQDGGVYYAVFGRRLDYVAAGLTYTVEFTDGLAVWVVNVTAPTPVATDGTIQAVRVPFPNTISTPSGPKKPTFFRVVISG